MCEDDSLVHFFKICKTEGIDRKPGSRRVGKSERYFLIIYEPLGLSDFRTSRLTLRSMTNFIPIFPLGIVVFPGENLNLHIFEPRYKQLIKECFEQKKPFGIPPVID